jgi:hypothetical protein
MHELQRAHHQVGGAVAPWCLELHLAGGVEMYPLVGQRRPVDVTAQMFDPLAVVRLDPHGSVEAESVDVGAQGLPRCAAARANVVAGGACLDEAGQAVSVTPIHPVQHGALTIRAHQGAATL